VVIREAREIDASGIRDVIRASYGDSYPYGSFYDVEVLKKLILGDDTVMLLAEESPGGRIVGTGSVLLEVEAYADLVGEFGRLAVVPDARRRGIASALMDARLQRIRQRLHVGIVDARVNFPFSSRIAQKHGFAPVGFCPLKDLFHVRESTAILAQWFGNALELRRNNPRITPEIHAIASVAMDNSKLPMDLVIDDSSAPYPYDDDFELEELTTNGYSSLLRIERGRTRHRVVFGPMRLHYGFFKLRASHAEYLIARRGSQIVGAIGFLRDDVEKIVRIFELITPDDRAIRFLLTEVERRCREIWGTAYLDIEVRADAPRMQRTLSELGFVPAAYVPAMVFHDVERLDVIRMCRLLVPLDLGSCEPTPEIQTIADLVVASLSTNDTLARIAPVVKTSLLFRGLNDEQTAQLAATCSLVGFATDDRIIGQGGVGADLFLILSGSVTILLDAAAEAVGSVGAGEALGEMGLLADAPHTATAIATEPVVAACLPYDDLNRLIRRRPDLGLVIYRNLARGLGRKLSRTDMARS
jgi:GNAT superfamily N-acetyltransferase